MAIYSTERLSEMMATLNAFVPKITTKVEKLNRRVNALSPKEIELGRKDVRFLHAAYRLLFIKQAVLTELRFYLKDDPQLQGRAVMALVQAFDYPDDWWLKKQALTMDAWLKVALEAIELELRAQDGGF